MKPISTTETSFAIPFHHFGGTGKTLHFAHANGFPPELYRQFLSPFTDQFEVIGIKHRPLWQKTPQPSDDWDRVADDIIHFFDQKGLKNVIGMGHSLGAVSTMFAAIKRPDLFEKIILIEPVFLPVPLLLFIYYFPFPRKYKIKLNPLVDITLNRKDVWENKEEVYASYRKKKVFKQIPDEILKDYIRFGITTRSDGKVTLLYTKEWEAHFYSLAPRVWNKLKQIETPILGIRGAQTDTILPSAWKRWKRLKPNHTFAEIKNAGHLVPLEKANETATVIFDFLKKS